MRHLSHGPVLQPSRRSAALSVSCPCLGDAGRLQPRTGAVSVPDAPSPRPFGWRPVTCWKVKGGEVRYLQLGRNEVGRGRTPGGAEGAVQLRREDQLDTEAVRRLVASLGQAARPGRCAGAHGPGTGWCSLSPAPTAADGLGGHRGGAASAMVARQLAQIGPLLDSEDRVREARPGSAAQTTSPSRWCASAPRAAAVLAAADGIACRGSTPTRQAHHRYRA